MHSRKLGLALVAATAIFSLLSTAGAAASPITADLTGTRTVGSGITATDGSKGSSGWASMGLSFTWSITPVAGGYDYSYTIDPAGQGGVSHLILEVSPNVTASNWLEYFSFASLTDIYAPQWWDASTGNPGMPDSVWGIKLNFGGNPVTYNFFSTKVPIWGDFYAKDGAFGSAWNTGFGTDPGSAPFTNWVATPDTISAPEPASLILLGTGLVGAARLFRKRRT